MSWFLIYLNYRFESRIVAGMARAKAQGKKFGRPAHKIETSEVIKAFEEAGSYSGAARLLSKKGLKVSPGFVQLRLKRRGASSPET
ncbi:MAG: hypothetical protein WC231_00415 [Dehalococcoidales bacterium]